MWYNDQTYLKPFIHNVMKHLLFSALVVLAVGLFAVPGAFADHLVISIDIALGSSVPGCEETADGCYILNTAVLSKADAQVTWYNTDNAAHTVTSGTPDDGPDGLFDSSMIMAGGQYVKDFERGFSDGTYDYYCVVHPWMTGIIIIGDVPEPEPEPEVEATIPDWIKNNAGWWADGSIDDGSFLNGISYLIQNNILVVPPTDAGDASSGTVPEWVKNTAGWWADGTIDDGTFVNAIQYLIKQGLIQV